MKISRLLLITVLSVGTVRAGNIIVIGHQDVPKLDINTLQRIYTGKVISVDGIQIIPVAIKPGIAERTQFLQHYLGQNEEKYTAYWTVRRYIGKGAPPLEFNNAYEIIDYVQTTAGAIGYIDEADLKSDMNIITRK